MTDFLEEKKREIKSRMDELEPLVDEFHRLKAAHDALSGVIADPQPRRSSSSSAPARKRERSDDGGGSGSIGRPKGSGPRRTEALELVRSRPGITIPEIAESMDMKQNYLYRVMPELQKDGLVRKEGRGWHALDAA